MKNKKIPESIDYDDVPSLRIERNAKKQNINMEKEREKICKKCPAGRGAKLWYANKFI